MKVRIPKMKYDSLRAHWSPNAEFAQIQNGQSLLPAYIEPYLVKVMVKAKESLDPANTKLHADLAIFIKQEMQHCKQHISFNRRLRELGYPGLASIEAEYAADYERFLKEKPLRWNLAYSEGFEAMSAIGVTAFFEEFDEFLEGADEYAVDLWKWHLAEEYEHREVAHDVFHALCGLNPVAAYFYRVYGFFCATKHIGGYSKRFVKYLLQTDRKSMTAEEVEESRARVKRINAVFKRRLLGHMLDILSPFYRPAKRKPPRGWAEYMTSFEARMAA